MASIPIARGLSKAHASERFGQYVGFGLAAAGILLFAGTLIDLGVLWLGQRQATAQWEFVAVATTTESFPRLTLAVALFYAALFVVRSNSLITYRLLAIFLLLFGFAGAGLGFLMATDYFVLAGTVPDQARQAFRTTVIKAVILSALYAVVLIPFGLLGLRKPRS